MEHQKMNQCVEVTNVNVTNNLLDIEDLRI